MNDEKILNHVLHTVQMGQSGIRCVMEEAVSPGLKKEMKHQLQMYDDMEKQALQLAHSKGWRLTDVSPAVQKMASMMSKMRLLGGQRDSKIAGMLIQGNTRGIILGSKNLHHSPKANADVRTITEKLIAQEQMSIENTKPYL